MQIQLSDHFTYRRLLRFTLPSVAMMIFTSIYSVVDGYFVSNYAGKTAFAAVNLIMPALMILGTVGFMFGTGGTAIVAKTCGEGDREQANRLFSLFVCVAAVVGTAFAVLGTVFIRPLAAALATAVSQTVGGAIPLVYFLRKNDSLLRLCKTRWDGLAVKKACVNGSSEFMSSVSMSIVGMLYNLQLIRYAGEDGVSAYGVMMYVSMIFTAVFVGYSIGVSPIVSFHDGARNTSELKSLLRKSLYLCAAFGAGMVLAAEALAVPLAKFFVGYDADLTELTVSGFRVFSLSFAFIGFGIFSSGFFTALNDGVTSAVISFVRTLVLESAAVILFPLVWGIGGIWFSVVFAEGAALLLGATFLVVKRKRYGY